MEEHRIVMESSNGEFHGPDNLVSVSAELYKVIRERDKTWSHFDSTLKQLGGKHEASEIIENACCGGDTLLHMAVKFGKQEIAQRIVDDFPQLIKKKNVKGDTPLHVAARSFAQKSSSLVKVILEANCPEYSKEARCIERNHFGNTPLHEAVIRSNFEGAQLLYKENEFVAHNYLNEENKSPFYVAVESRKRKMVDLLLHAPIDTEDNNKSNNSPLAAILRIHQGEIKRTSCLWTHGKGLGADPATHFDTSRPERSTRGYLDILNHILEKRPELKRIKDEKGNTPLHWAALLGHFEGVRKLLEEDAASALESNKKGYLPIHLASKKGHVSVVKEILNKVEWFDPVDLLNQKGQNILHMAAKNGKHQVVKYILREKKLEKLLNEKDNKGNTPLHSASKYLHPKVLLLLTQNNNVDLNLVNNSGMTARDVVLKQIKVPLTFRELLSSEILLYAGTPLSENGKLYVNVGSKGPQVQWIKDHASTLMLVTILVSTVTFAAGFTVPGGFVDSNDNDITNRGMAALINELMFKVFIICDVVAMYSSTFAAFILLWAKLGDFHMAVSATHFALLLVAVALVTMSTAFMAAIYLIVRNLCWLAHTVIIMGIIFLSMFLLGFALLMFPTGAPIPLLNYIARVIFMMMIPFSGSYSKVKERKLYKKSSKPTQQVQTQGGPEQQQSPELKYMVETLFERLRSDTFKYMLEKY